MSELWIDCLRALKNYTGLRLLLGLPALALVFLFLREKRKTVRIVFVFAPLLTGLLFLCPLTLKLYRAVGLDPDTYYRMLWTIPLGLLTVYAMISLMGEHRIAGVIISAALIGLTGRWIYTSPILYPTENVYGLPQTTVNIVDYLRSIDDHQRITVLPSSDIITSIRQYDADILMPYGRDMFNPANNYYHPVYEALEKPAVIRMDELLAATREYDVQYLILYAALLTDKDPEEAGLVYRATVDDHRIYEDPIMTERIRQIDQYYAE